MADYASLEKKYKGFRVPQVAVYVKGQKIDTAHYNLTSLTVDSTAENSAAGVCEMVFSGIFDAKRSKVDTALLSAMEVHQPLEIRMGYATPAIVFFGKIDSVDISYGFGSDSGPTLRVTGIDAKGILMRAKEAESKNVKSTAEVVEGIVKQLKSDGAIKNYEIGKLLQFETPLRQDNSTDFDYLCEIARLSLCNFYITDGKLYFKNMLSKADKCITLEWGKSLISFSRVTDLSRQITKVIVTGTSLKDSKPVKGESDTVAMGGSGKLASQMYKSLKPTEEMENVLATTPEIAAKIARAELTWRALDYVTCQGSCIGLPDIKAGKWMQVKGMSEYVDSTYFIQQVKHSFDEQGYLTSFTLKGARSPK